MAEPDEFVSLLEVMRVGARGDVLSTWLGSNEPSQQKKWWSFLKFKRKQPMVTLSSSEEEKLSIGQAAKATDVTCGTPKQSDLKVANSIEVSTLDDAVAPLVADLKDADDSVRNAAAKALGELGDLRAVEPLGVALTDKNLYVRQSAAYALGNIKDPHAIELLIVTLKDTDNSVRRAAISALERLGGPVAERELAEYKASGGAVKDHPSQARSVQTETLSRNQSPQSIVDALTAELISISQREGFLSMQPGGKFNKDCRHIRAREIGSRLNQIDGLQLMQKVGYEVARFGRGRELEAAWDGIGSWLG